MATDQSETISSDNAMADSKQSLLVGKKKRMSKQERKALKRQRQQQRPQPPQQKRQQPKTEVMQRKTVGSGDLDVALKGGSVEKNNKNNKKKKKRNKRTKNRTAPPDKVSPEGSDHSQLKHNTNQFEVEVEDEDRIHRRCMESYKPIEIPTQPSKHLLSRSSATGGGGETTSTALSTSNQHQAGEPDGEGGGRSLGKWFPNAILVKCRVSYTNTGQLLLAKNNTTTNDDDDYKKDETVKGFDEGNDHGVKPLPSSTESQHDNPSNKPRASLALFYQYTDSGVGKGHWTKPQLQLLMTYLQIIALKRNVGGRIRVAPEGVNATISAVDTLHCTAQATLRHVAEDLRRFDSVFNRTDFKFIDSLKSDRHFKDLKILPVQELVFYDIQSNEAPLSITSKNEDGKVMDHDHGENDHDSIANATKDGSMKVNTSGITGVHHLDAQQYHEMLQRDNTVVIDVRNHYETILGRFDGQMMKQPQHQLQQQHQHQHQHQNHDQKKKKKNDDDDEGNSKRNKSSKSPTDSSSSSMPSMDNKGSSALQEQLPYQSETKKTENVVGSTGAVYIDPKMRKSTDFKEWLSKEETKNKIKGKTVMMFCTGGIRCERASVYLKGQMGDDVGQVYQLQGGIERYLKAFPDGGMWRGKNFVFDKREAVGADCPNGDGGVVQKASSRSKNESDESSGSHVPKCCVCSRRWDRYVGKKFCSTCGVPLLVCDACLSKRVDKIPGMELKMRCPLCVEEDVTVLASQTEFTNNGINSKRLDNPSTFEARSMAEQHDPGVPADNANGSNASKAAGSILKWGGGHALQKKQRKKLRRTFCRFGVDCTRTDCLFYHPERDSTNAKCKVVRK